VTWTGSAWACGNTSVVGNLSVTGNLIVAGSPNAMGGLTLAGPLSVAGTSDLLGNGAADGRIAPFNAGDPSLQTNASYDAAHAARLPLYTTTDNGSGDLSALCRKGDLLVAGGCVASSDTCYLARSYPIIFPTNAQSGWHCRVLDRTSGAACLLTAISVCLKSF
jgi:hypothetical protein